MATPIGERTLTLDALGITTRVLEAGSGRPVVMFHGNPDNADEWVPLIERISARHRCIAPDFPGYGKSPEPPATFTYSLADQMRFVDAVLEAMHVDEPFVLVVHDTGGMVGTAWAGTHVERLRGMVVTNTVAFSGFTWFKIALQWADDSWRGRLRSKLALFAMGLNGGALFKKAFAQQCPQLDAAQLERFAQSFALNADAKRTTLRQFKLCTKPDFFDAFAGYRERILSAVPVRVLWGDKDAFIGVEYATAFGSKQVTILPEAGHWVALVAPDELAAEVEAIG